LKRIQNNISLVNQSLTTFIKSLCTELSTRFVHKCDFAFSMFDSKFAKYIKNIFDNDYGKSKYN